MNIPIVGEQIGRNSSNGALRASSVLYTDSAKVGVFSVSQHFSKDSALSTSLVKDAKELATDEDQPLKIKGFLAGALNELGTLSERLTKLQSRLDSELLNEEQRKGLQGELKQVKDELGRIVDSEPFKKTMEVVGSLTALIQNGSVSRRSLSSATALLGDDFINLAASGSLASVQTISHGLDRLSTLAQNDNVADFTKSIKEESNKLLGLLSRAPAKKQVVQEEQKQESIKLISPPELTQHSFESAGNLALSLRGYSGKDLLRAVAGGFVDNVESISQLIIEAPKKKDEEDDELEKVEKDKAKAQSATRNGLSFNSAQKKTEILQAQNRTVES